MLSNDYTLSRWSFVCAGHIEAKERPDLSFLLFESEMKQVKYSNDDHENNQQKTQQE